MPCSGSCRISLATFHFEKAEKTYPRARRKCQELGGDLAVTTNQLTWERLRECCNTEEEFWVGLRRCGEQNTYRNLDQPAIRCRSLPFIVPDRHVNETCQAVLMNPGRSNGIYPEAKLESCFIKNSYICQIRNAASTESTSTTEEHRNNVFVDHYTNFNKRSIATFSTTAASMDIDHENQSSPIDFNLATNSTFPQIPQNIPIAWIAGGLLATLVIALLLAVVLHCRKKLRKPTQHQEINPSKDRSSNPRSFTARIQASEQDRVNSDDWSHDPVSSSSDNTYNYIAPIAPTDYAHYVNFPVSSDQKETLENPYDIVEVVQY
ncbi:uncharacterized protein LOC143446288 [Clavelina lepadiformis]|uniref:uncharacterized protein LOC143446288 n=1 Tax=Clavelina lepadiformis TaxID=159417 RepID=UPI004042CD75